MVLPERERPSLQHTTLLLLLPLRTFLPLRVNQVDSPRMRSEILIVETRFIASTIAYITIWLIDNNNTMDIVWHYHKFVQFYEREMFGYLVPDFLG